jgi:hypothetical protein
MFKKESICRSCNKVFEHYVSQKRKYCSRECYDKPGRAKRTDDQKIKIQGITKAYYDKASEEEKRKRWDKISKSKTKTLTDDEQQKILNVLSWGYVTDIRAIIHHAKIKDKGIRPVTAFLKEKGFYKNSNVKYIPLSFQMWDIKKFLVFKQDSEKMDHRAMEKKYKMGEKRFKNICDKLKIRWGKIETPEYTETWPERKVEMVLQDLKIVYTKQTYFLDHRYRADFILQGSKVLEVNGDYWHANPDVYNYDNLSAIQMKNVVRDLKRRADCKQHNIPLLEVWERDIRLDIEQVKQKIQEYANKQF